MKRPNNIHWALWRGVVTVNGSMGETRLCAYAQCNADHAPDSLFCASHTLWAMANLELFNEERMRNLRVHFKRWSVAMDVSSNWEDSQRERSGKT